MNTVLWILGSTFFVSILALVGIFSIIINEKRLQKLLLFLVSLSAGALLGGAFLHLIPEAVETSGTKSFIFILLGFLIFFLVEKVLHWRHCHEGKCEIHTFAHMSLIGDSVHNFIDGLVIAAGFVADVQIGITTTIAVALHEIPQELGDFGVLVHGGFSKSRALFLNFITALTAVLGGLFGYFLYSYTNISLAFLIPLAAGGFIYIAASDLVPEIRKEKNIGRALAFFAVMILGIALIYALKFFVGEH